MGWRFSNPCNLFSSVVRFCFPIIYTRVAPPPSAVFRSGCPPCLLTKIPAFPDLGDHARSPDHPIFPVPPHFLPLVANKALPQFDPRASLAPRLGGPWVAQGWPRGHPNPVPNPIPSRQRVAKLPKNTKRNGISVAPGSDLA